MTAFVLSLMLFASAEPAAVVSLDGPDWLLLPDPQNVGLEKGWQNGPQPGAKKTKVPWIIQDAFPGYHGVAWYWRDFTPGANQCPCGRTLLRFWAVDYKADVFLNGQPLGTHEGGETPFVLDATAIIKPGLPNRLAVRVLNPTHTPIDGIVLNETPHRNKVIPYTSGSAWNQGGIIDTVELLYVPAVRIDDLFVRADPATGRLRIETTLINALPEATQGQLRLTVSPAAGGPTLAEQTAPVDLPTSQQRIQSVLVVRQPHLWDLNDPYLYRVTATLTTDKPAGADEATVRTGFRDFRFDRGFFRLNGRRIYLRCSHTGNCCPIGLEMPHDPDFLRRDLINAKAMGFNAIRFISGVAKRYQLDLCDEIGLMVYEEAYASWCLADSPKMAARYDDSILSMVRRDRNHPSVAIWGLLNETPDGAVFRHAAGLLPKLRLLDDSRMVMLNSGRWDSQGGGLEGIEAWHNPERVDPCVSRNSSDHVIKALGITWQPGQLSFHPGRDGEFAVVRWTAPAAGNAGLAVRFHSIAERATTDVHVLHNGRPLFDGGINLGGGPEAKFESNMAVAAGDALDFVVGYGNGNYGADTTALAVSIVLGEKKYDAAADFSYQKNPAGPWSYGFFAPGKPDAKAFRPFTQGQTNTSIGSLSNPGSAVWEDVLADTHPYQHVPHSADVIRTLRTHNPTGQPVFLSEYGIGSAIDLIRVTRHYERAAKTEVEDARLYRQWLDQFLADYQRWKLDEAFARPEDFFEQSIARMAGQRLLGLNAIRSNPQIVGHSITGTLDQGMTAEGLWTTFRELKPGTVDAVFDGFAPLRWCLFAEPWHIYRKGSVKLEAVLANEDMLRPGKYPVRLLVVGPDNRQVFQRRLTVEIPEKGKTEVPMVLPIFAADVPIDGPSGRYRFLVGFEQGAAAAGGVTEFLVTDPAEMPKVERPVTLWGDDAELAAWLASHGITTRPYGPPVENELILVSTSSKAPGDAAVWAELTGRIERGATAIFLSPAVFRSGDQPLHWLPLPEKGTLVGLPAWLYHKDEWNKPHPIFAGLPSGSVMDYLWYRDIIPDVAFVGQIPPEEALCGGINASQGYSSGLMLAVHRRGSGRMILTTLRIRENLGRDPVAERLLRNLLRW